MLDERVADTQFGDFALGRPVLVCRWRLAQGALPLQNRHLRALSRRSIDGAPISPQLVGWAKQHVEWTLKDGSAANPDGVLMLVVDANGCAAMTVGGYEPLPRTHADVLLRRAFNASKEAEKTGVAPETVWAFQDDQLLWGIGRDQAASGSASLMADLANTLGFTLIRVPNLVRALREGGEACDELFLVSDEHGVVPASNVRGPRSTRFAADFRKLFV